MTIAPPELGINKRKDQTLGMKKKLEMQRAVIIIEQIRRIFVGASPVAILEN